MLVKLAAYNRHFVTVSLPLLALLGAFAIAYPRYKTLIADQISLESTRRDISIRATTLAELEAKPTAAIVARVPATPDEPVEFLRNLNYVAGSCGVKIVMYTSAPTPPPVAPTEAGGAQPTGDNVTLPAGTTANTLDITAEGNYASVAQFFQRLETYPRLINVSQVRMQTKAYPTLTTQFRLSRYTGVTPGPAA